MLYELGNNDVSYFDFCYSVLKFVHSPSPLSLSVLAHAELQEYSHSRVLQMRCDCFLQKITSHFNYFSDIFTNK